jgi:hypothetical protein
MGFFRNVSSAANRSPDRSIYGVNSSGEIIAPIDLCVLEITSGSIINFIPNLPAKLAGVDIILSGGSPIGSILPTANPSPVGSVDPIVRLNNLNTINFPATTSISQGDVLLPGEIINFVTSGGAISGGKLMNAIPDVGLPYLNGLFSVDAFQATFTNSPGSRDIGSMVMVPRLNKSLGMLLGFSLGSSIIFPAFMF